MRIGNNGQGIWQLLSRMNGGKANTNMLFGSSALKGNYCGNTIDDLRSGHFKNSYGVEGMGITGKTDWKRIVNVSEEMKQHVYEDVKKGFYKYGGMSGDNTAETDAYYDKIHSYVKSLDLSTRRAAPWTLSQLHLEISGGATQAVKEKDPTWTAGQPISHEILDEIFAGDAIFQDRGSFTTQAMEWPAYTRESSATMIFDTVQEVVYHHDDKLMSLLAPDYEYKLIIVNNL